MGFFKSLFRRRKKVEEPVEKQESWDEVSLKRDEVDLLDAMQRERYIRGCLEQIAESSEASEKLSGEYNIVTAYLTDIEEIEALPAEEAELLKSNARSVIALGQERKNYVARPGRMQDGQYHQLECMEEEIEEGLQKILSAEEYQGLIKQDLMKLDGERHAYQYRRNELRAAMENAKGMAVICATAIAACFLLLLLLQFLFHMNAQSGYLITAAAAAIVITMIDLRYLDAKKELKKVENAINRLIILQNRVKIRYVNNTNLLDYYYLKYQVEKGSDLEKLWKQYQEEKEEREKFRQASVEFDFYQKELLKQLNRLPIQDPSVWLHQTEALVNPKEMVEIRHGLIVRRQKLRTRVEYNNELVKKAQEEMRSIASQYPEYAHEILALVEEYEK